MSEVLYELGVDFDSSLSFKDGDLELIAYDKNLVQGVMNRLKTELDELSLFYEEYGSLIFNYLGWKASDETLSIIKIEVDTVLKKEPRLQGFESNVEYNSKGNLLINLTLYPNSNTSIETNLVLNEFGSIEETSEEE